MTSALCLPRWGHTIAMRPSWQLVWDPLLPALPSLGTPCKEMLPGSYVSAVAALAVRLKGRDSGMCFSCQFLSDEDAVWEWEKTAHGPLPLGFLLQCAALESDMGIDETYSSSACMASIP